MFARSPHPHPYPTDVHKIMRPFARKVFRFSGLEVISCATLFRSEAETRGGPFFELTSCSWLDAACSYYYFSNSSLMDLCLSINLLQIKHKLSAYTHLLMKDYDDELLVSLAFR